MIVCATMAAGGDAEASVPDSTGTSMEEVSQITEEVYCSIGRLEWLEERAAIAATGIICIA